MKRIKFLLVFVLTLSLTACTSCADSSNARSGSRRSQDRSLINMTDEQVETVDRLMDYIINKDGDGLKSMFCEAVSLSVNLGEQIQAAFDFFDSEIVSYSGIGGGGIDKATERGKITRLAFRPIIRNIETDSGCNYSLRVSSYLVFDEHPDKVGISKIIITAENEKECVIGYSFVW